MFLKVDPEEIEEAIVEYCAKRGIKIDGISKFENDGVKYVNLDDVLADIIFVEKKAGAK